MGKVVDEIEAGVGNTILSAILRAIKEKTKNPPERNSTSTNRHSEWQRQCTVQLISSVGKLLGQFSDSSRDRLHDASNQVFGRGDLSKEQRCDRCDTVSHFHLTPPFSKTHKKRKAGL